VVLVQELWNGGNTFSALFMVMKQYTKGTKTKERHNFSCMYSLPQEMDNGV
jgi:hypothetical protein